MQQKDRSEELTARPPFKWKDTMTTPRSLHTELPCARNQQALTFHPKLLVPLTDLPLLKGPLVQSLLPPSPALSDCSCLFPKPDERKGEGRGDKKGSSAMEMGHRAEFGSHHRSSLKTWKMTVFGVPETPFAALLYSSIPQNTLQHEGIQDLCMNIY